MFSDFCGFIVFAVLILVIFWFQAPRISYHIWVWTCMVSYIWISFQERIMEPPKNWIHFTALFSSIYIRIQTTWFQWFHMWEGPEIRIDHGLIQSWSAMICHDNDHPSGVLSDQDQPVLPGHMIHGDLQFLSWKIGRHMRVSTTGGGQIIRWFFSIINHPFWSTCTTIYTH